MTQYNKTSLGIIKYGLAFLVKHACFNGMEQALVGDMLELLNKVEKYPLVYKIEVSDE